MKIKELSGPPRFRAPENALFIVVVFLACSLFPLSVMTQPLPDQSMPEWTCFHGPDRTNKSNETGLLGLWPEAGPELLWTVSGLGRGYSSVSLADGTIFISGSTDQQTFVFAFDLDGKLIWKKQNGIPWSTERSWARTYNGARSTPTCSEGLVYHLGELGRLAALDARSGEEVWSMELREAFDAEIPEYGYSESVHIEGDKLYCCPAGKKAFLVCLDKYTGKLVWANTEIPGTVGFSSLIIFDHGGYRQITGLSSNCVFGVDMKTGKLLWQVDFKNDRDNNVTDPIFHEGYIFASSGYGKGSILFRLDATGGEIIPELIWQTELLDNHHGGVILHQGNLYGAGHNARGWFCLDFKTGKQKWNSGGKGSLTFAEDMLYCLDERGIMTLVKATPERYEQVSTFEVPEGGDGMHWAHPVVCGGRLYIRHQDKLFAYDISPRIN
jgi:outer membrane protein assembly factor BamB